MLEIQKYIYENGLDKSILDFGLKAKFYKDKVLLKYDQLCSNEIMAIPAVQECRGLILELNTWKVLNMAFKKFFNLQEVNAHKIDFESAHILEKLDGTLISLYYHNNTWHTSTTGTAEGEGEVNNKNGTTFSNLFWETINKKYPNFKLEYLSKNVCYAFELTTPWNIVVNPHSDSSVTLLTARNLDEKLKELSREELIDCAKSLHLPIVKSFDINKDINNLLKTLENMPWQEEGYVIVDKFFNRVKIKNPKYLAVHHLKGKTAEHNILTIIKSNEIEEFASTFIDRREELYKLKENYEKLISSLNDIWKNELFFIKPTKEDYLEINSLKKKQYAEKVFDVCNKNNLKQFSGLFFGLANGKINSIEEYILEYDDKQLYKIL